MPPASPAAATYSYVEVADRIEEVLGERPSLSSLRAESAAVKRVRALKARPRLTAGLPAPLPAVSRTTAARFDVDEVEAWLSTHPRRVWEESLARSRDALAAGWSVGEVVRQAREDHLSWQQITAILNAHDGGRRSAAGVHVRYRYQELADGAGLDVEMLTLQQCPDGWVIGHTTRRPQRRGLFLALAFKPVQGVGGRYDLVVKLEFATRKQAKEQADFLRARHTHPLDG